MSWQTCLVTGGAGFIGSNLAHALAAAGRRVRVLDDFSTGRAGNLEPLPAGVEVVRGDLRAPDALARALAGVERVFHLAAIPSVQRSVEDPMASYLANTHATFLLLEACRVARIPRLVFASSSSVYGDSLVSPKVETLPTSPISPYAASKLASEWYCRVYTRTFGLETVALRFFNVYGPRQNPDSQYSAAIPRFIRRLLEGRPPTIYGDGETSRDFTFVEDVVAALTAASERPEPVGGVYNIACGRSISLNALIAALNEILGTALRPEYAPPRVGDIKHSLADIGRARADLGYSPQFDLEAGLCRTVEWFRKHPS
ncbi:MAG: SDR family oxidoreductase [Planctomycetes bacterium]|nr:SDR family oxidoreductase [Planctomycetota bacterium]